MALTGTITLSWTKNTDLDLAGYKVYYGTSPGVYIAPIDVGLTSTPNNPSYTITNLLGNVTYYVTISAYDNATPANESTFSVEVQQTISVPFTNVTFG